MSAFSRLREVFPLPQMSKSTILPLFILVLFFVPRMTVAQTFQHPGVLVSKAQLDFIKSQVDNKVDPIYSAYKKAVASPYGSLTYVIQGPPAGGDIDCGPTSNPNHGCSAEDSDGSAAVTQALLWYISGNKTYAQNAIKILNAYGKNLKSYTNANAPLQAAWGSEKWPMAAEIIRYSNAGWSAADITTFQNMLRNVIQPMIENGSTSNGNWELSMIDGMIGIGVFNDDATLFNKGVAYWQQRVPAYFYYHTDGSQPLPAPRGNPSWYGQTTFNSSVDGIAQETCRDFGHTEYSIAAATHAAETAHIQGKSLFEAEEPRLSAALGFHARYLLGTPVPSYVCGGSVTLVQYPTFEVGYNEFHNRLGYSMPNTLNWIETNVRTQSDPVDWHMMIFETLTHGADAGEAAPTPTPTPTATPKPTATATPKPTATPTATPQPTATATPKPTATPTATPKPTATATPSGTCAAAWTVNVAYSVGQMVSYQGENYKCLQAHTSETGWDPVSAPALWSLVGACK